MTKNRARFAIAILVVMLVLNMMGDGPLKFFMPTVKAEPVQDSLIAQMISQMNEAEIYNTAYCLQNFTTRAYGYPGNVEAATYLYNRLSNISGLSVEYQSDYYNIVATLPGVDSTSNDIFVVGAHYDSISSDPSVYAPGATDNGCGVGVVLEFARIMSQYSFNHTIKFALWNNEESGDVGSLEYVKYADSNKINVSLYFNFDGCCYDPDGQMILDIISNQQSSWVSDMMTEYNTLYGIYWTLTYNVLAAAGTDHFSFWDYGYTAVWTSSESWGPIHTEWDTIDKVSTAYAVKDGQLCMSVLAALAKGVASPPTPTPGPTPSPTPLPGSQIPAVTAIASTFNGVSHGPLNAIDGVESTSNYWGTAAVFGLPQWLRIDLGFATNINQTITHFYDGDARTYTYYIEASAEGSQWTTVVPTKTGSEIVTDTFAQVNARYVRITVTGNTANTAAHIEEIKVYQGTLPPSPSPTSSPSPSPTPTVTPSPTPSSSPSPTSSPSPSPTPTVTPSPTPSSSPSPTPTVTPSPTPSSSPSPTPTVTPSPTLSSSPSPTSSPSPSPTPTVTPSPTPSSSPSPTSSPSPSPTPTVTPSPTPSSSPSPTSSPSPSPTPTVTPSPTPSSSPSPTPTFTPSPSPSSSPTPTVTPTLTPTPSPSPTPVPGSQIRAVTATASSFNGESYRPLNAIDGVESTSNYWGTAAVFGLPQWLRIDLGSAVSISQVVTHFYDGNDRTYTYYIETSIDGSSWIQVVSPKIGSGIVTDTFAQVNARYVRLTVMGNTANTAAHVEEIKVYQSTGIPTPTPTPSPSPTPTFTPSPSPSSSPTPTVTPTLTPTPSPSPTPVPGSQIRAVTATASSFNGESYGPLNAIDGVESTSNYWGTAAVFGLPQWLRIDLGSAVSISQVVTHFYDGNDRTYTYYIETSIDGSSWIQVVSPKIGSGIVTDTFAQVNARYVRLTVMGNTANTAAHVEEIKVYQSTGIPTPTPTPSPSPTPTFTPSPSPSSSPTPTVTPTLTPTPSPSPTPVPGSQIRAVTATASSFNGESYGPLNAIDGVESTSNYWGTAAVFGLPQWLRIDLGSAVSISQVVTHFYDGNDRTYTYYVDVSVDGFSWTSVVATKAGSGVVTDTFSPVYARYVRLTVTGNTANTAAHIEEIKVFSST